MLLSVGLLGNQSIQALFPSLGIISDHLASLPKDSPAFGMLFAISLANRIQEDIRHGITANSLHTFFTKDPLLATLPLKDKTKLIAALHVSQLCVAGKLLEENLGLQGLIAHLLPYSFPPNQV